MLEPTGQHAMVDAGRAACDDDDDDDSDSRPNNNNNNNNNNNEKRKVLSRTSIGRAVNEI
jgi:hypothetical protein